ncbi:S8 family serine peptidase [Fervidobacterium islandicum]|uniref:S8 family serine peptidase n=1 Tax=Fervidobacterium islandicum TaxID=2423 RepID=A0AAI8GDG2_FERIS|nr:S8 family serine peptidase [Fervidobacterium islandicum]AMW32976.1 S8 family serine peptidase [Fervidobacterium islandicum]
MRKAFLIISVVALLLALFSCTNPSFEPRNEIKDLTSLPEIKPNGFNILFGELKDGEYTEGRILVGYNDRKEVDKIVKAVNGKIVLEIPEIKVVSIKLNNMTVKQAYDKIKTLKLSGIRYVEPSYKRELIKPTVVKPNPEMFKIGKPGLNNTRNYGEELSNELWGLEALGITTTLWEEASGTGVIVAVVDTGVDGTHPDLQGQVIGGYRPAFDEELPAGTDSSFGGAHGTHVAGTIAAKKDGKGIVGVAPGAKIMPIVIFDDPALVGGNGYVGDDFVAAGIVWAVDHGAKVMNHSWGGRGYSYTMKEAFDYALKNGVVMVVSAGNNTSDSHHQYPAGYPGVVQVAALEYYGGTFRVASFSSRSDGVSVGAPGVAILSTVPGVASLGYEGHNPNVPVTNGGTYDYYQGTSMAAPHVTGAVAVLLQKFPNAKPWQIRKLLENTAYDFNNNGWDHDTGYGLVKLNTALEGSLPTAGGVEEFQVVVTDAYEEWGVPTVFVSLMRDNGSCYFAKTGLDGIARFPHIDEGTYKIIVGGPDHWDRALAPYGGESQPGAYAISWRMEEERQAAFDNFDVSQENPELTVNFSSTFKVKFDTDLTGVRFPEFVIVDPALRGIYGRYKYQKGREYDISYLSGPVALGIQTLLPAQSDILIQGTVTINGYEIPVRGVLKQGTTWVIMDEYGGLNLNTPSDPLYIWWTVFGME